MDLRKVTLVVFILGSVLCGAAAQTTCVYVGNFNDNTVSGYAANHLTGVLTPVPGSPFATGAKPIAGSLDQQCRFVYIANEISSNVTGYTVDANTGGTAPIAGSPFATGALPNHSALDRFGKFLYVPNQGLNDVGTTLSAFSINPDTSALTEISGSPFTTGQGPGFILMDPSNRFLYVSNDGDGTVSGFTINPNTGGLTAISGSPWSSGGSNPRWIAVDSTGQFLYVSNTVSGNVEVFAVCKNDNGKRGYPRLRCLG